MIANNHIRDILRQIPESPGVYQHLNKDGEIIYVGKAKNLKRRVNSYFNKEHDSLKTAQLVKNIADIHYIVVDSEQDAFLLENNLIKKYQPKYNILLKDGKSYPYICITKEEYPRVFKTRNIDKKTGEYFGPYSFTNSLDLVLELIRNIYPLRTCKQLITIDNIEKNKYKLCLKYHIKTCCGVCENKTSKEEYEGYINEVRKIIQGDAHEISKKLLIQMGKLADELKFEEAAKLKNKYDLIEKFRSNTIITNISGADFDAIGYFEDNEKVFVSILKIHNGSIVQGLNLQYRKQIDEESTVILSRAIHDLRERISSDSREILVPFLPDFIENNLFIHIPKSGDKKKLLDLSMHNAKECAQDISRAADKLNPDQRSVRVLKTLQEKLKLLDFPVLIDSFDNSHIQGSDAVAACVVFKMGKPSKKDYKLFIVKLDEGTDDYASMREIVYRRYKRVIEDGVPLPNLIIADGGQGQMNAIKEALRCQLNIDIPVAGLKKDNHHRTATLLYGDPAVEIGLKTTDELFLFLTRIQDEVHRFAISFHKNKRSKRQIKSELDEIYGIGIKSKMALLNHFGSVKRLKDATYTDIEKIVGSSRASAVYKYFHG